MRIFSFLILFSFAFGHENLNTLIVEFPENTEPQLKETIIDVELECTSWRFAVEANNLSPWKTIPKECADYVRQYINGGAYKLDIDRVSSEAGAYAESMKLGADGKDVWIFDVDETLLSNLPYYSQHGYGLEVFDSVKFDEWVEKGVAPAIGSSLKLYQDVMRLGFKVFLLTGRSERHRIVTVENLMNAGFQDWDKLILSWLLRLRLYILDSVISIQGSPDGYLNLAKDFTCCNKFSRNMINPTWSVLGSSKGMLRNKTSENCIGQLIPGPARYLHGKRNGDLAMKPYRVDNLLKYRC